MTDNYLVEALQSKISKLEEKLQLTTYDLVHIRDIYSRKIATLEKTINHYREMHKRLEEYETLIYKVKLYLGPSQWSKIVLGEKHND